ncbi:MAG: membrane dipeptidase, partial [Planctomycetaceae bacterium]|nr:membrane dipeptidase [Planctomycetaceae bacterium]
YAIKKFGADHVAMGTDIAYSSRNDTTERAKIGKRPDGRSLSLQGARWEHLWPPFEFRESSEATQSIAWTNWPLFTIGMVQRGHSDETIRKVLGENVLRVWKANYRQDASR